MKKNIKPILLLSFMIISMLLISACSLIYSPESINESDIDLGDVTLNAAERNEIMYDELEVDTSNTDERELIRYADDDIDESDVSLTINAIEGELIDLQPKVEDPDNDKLELSFSGPFNEAGLWQTSDGDEGKYLITISATDGDLTTKEYVLINVYARNKGPIVECPEKITVFETETVKIACNVYDKEQDSFMINYSGWMDSNEYVTTYDDSGEYTVLVTVTDAEKNIVQKEISIIVKNKNRPPVLSGIDDIEAVETEVIVLDFDAYDPDGDELSIMFSDPFDEDGIWATEDGDDGVHESFVKVSDGIDTVSKNFKIIVDNINTRPYLAPIPEIVVNEGNLIEIDVDASDAEGDTLSITFSGWMDSDEYLTTFDDAGTHYVKVTVSDGRLESSQNVKIIVNNVNRPPVFIIPG